MTGSPLSMSSAASSADAGRELRAAETPYVVLLDAYTSLAAPPLSQQQQQQQPPPREAVQLCWAFEHTQDERRAKHVLAQGGLPLTNGHNARSCNLTFDVAHEGTCHGLAGYFEAQLFDDVFVSIHPDAGRASQDMLSWFPIFFPFKVGLFPVRFIALNTALTMSTGTGPALLPSGRRDGREHVAPHQRPPRVVRVVRRGLSLAALVWPRRRCRRK